jgi:glycosyltransferase involved in cell wall biosynthesis
MSERITWLMSVRNSMPFLRETLASVAAQTYTDHELLVWDDASTDGTMEELHSWIPARIPGTIFSGRSFRLGKNLAFLVEQAKTELCARIDGDDINFPNRLERQVAHMKAHPEVVALGSQVKLIDAEGNPLAGPWNCPLEDAEVRWRTRWQSGLTHPSVIFRREAVLRAGNYADIESEDCELWIRLSRFGEMYSLPEVLLLYRRHAASLSGAYTDFFAGQLRSARHASAHLFPGLSGEEALALWETTHPEKVDAGGPVSLRHMYQLTQSAKLLARQCGKPDDYFKSSPTYRSQAYWLRKRLLQRRGLSTLAQMGQYLKERLQPAEAAATEPSLTTNGE